MALDAGHYQGKAATSLPGTSGQTHQNRPDGAGYVACQTAELFLTYVTSFCYAIRQSATDDRFSFLRQAKPGNLAFDPSFLVMRSLMRLPWLPKPQAHCQRADASPEAPPSRELRRCRDLPEIRNTCSAVFPVQSLANWNRPFDRLSNGRVSFGL